MSIPLDRLYHYIEDIAKQIYGDIVLIYCFYPHGSKKLENLSGIRTHTNDWITDSTALNIYMHDQEPLNYDMYENYDLETCDYHTLYKKLNVPVAQNIRIYGCVYDKVLLVHSEQRSANLEKYQQNYFITVYYWNHAILALDWFRYAEHVAVKKSSTTKFLIYNRAWSGTREYRLKFADLLIDHDLVGHCKTSLGFVDTDIHYSDYKFKNNSWKPNNVLENYFSTNLTTSNYSADFDEYDYQTTDIEIVLETLFDDDRLHLTEKSLRPMALAQPFILATTHGSLEYLRSYGFKTFDSVWDEGYDKQTDPEKRLNEIVMLMREISQWDETTRTQKLAQAQAIADYNKQHFFSKEFLKMITMELHANLTSAVGQFRSSISYQKWVNKWNYLLTQPCILEYLDANQDIRAATKPQVDYLLKKFSC